jgi:hypothetical protein
MAIRPQSVALIAKVAPRGQIANDYSLPTERLSIIFLFFAPLRLWHYALRHAAKTVPRYAMA